MEFEKKLKILINTNSIENESNTPDFILAQYIRNCLNAFNDACNSREKWYGINNKMVIDKQLDPISQPNPNDQQSISEPHAK